MNRAIIKITPTQQATNGAMDIFVAAHLANDITRMLIGLDAGTGTLFTVLIASASYIAVTAAMRLALPQAKIAIYLPMSLAITFPFNIIIAMSTGKN